MHEEKDDSFGAGVEMRLFRFQGIRGGGRARFLAEQTEQRDLAEAARGEAESVATGEGRGIQATLRHFVVHVIRHTEIHWHRTASDSSSARRRGGVRLPDGPELPWFSNRHLRIAARASARRRKRGDRAPDGGPGRSALHRWPFHPPATGGPGAETARG